MKTFIRTLAVALALSLLPLATIAPSVVAWDATVMNCESAGQSSQVLNSEHEYRMLLFQDGMQPRYSFDYGWHEVDKGGEYLVRWVDKAGEFHPDSDSIWVKQCPPLERPDPIVKNINVTCVEGRNGIDTRVQVDVTYNTRQTSRPLPLWAKIRIDGTLRMDRQVDTVEGWGSWGRSWYAGQGEHWVQGYVRVGPVKKYITRTVHCDVVEPAAWLNGPYGDPEYHSVYSNAKSTVALPFIWRYVQDGVVIKHVREVPAGANFATKCRVIDPGTSMWVNYVRPDGKRVRLLTIDESAPLDVYPECPDHKVGTWYPN